jgi:hypothetical protein
MATATDPKLDAIFRRIASIEISLTQLREVTECEVTRLKCRETHADIRIAALEARHREPTTPHKERTEK